MNDLVQALVKAGAPVLGTVIGGPVGALATAAIGALADALGTQATPEAVKEAIETKPEATVIVRQVEAERGQELATYAALVAQEGERGWFYSAWRPAGMWLVLIMWPFAVVLAPFFRISVPMADLVAFTGLYLTLYMGGHTAKEWFNAHYGGRK
ncbi:hypothetical protein [Bosea sp. (in: a-proteobacteria)]|uniref:hypothetical protein n=1 Tax=Bosea sp. (in: a-proteobacteria) TaxID=1871050 RepID=UPI00260FA5F2|nr:hypothetical protein [Bosea sp. (in: a-proteobacteria)]MCO5092681.1 hypothetical protein [Bosea sp. (in: a-proteobacteria)]